MDDAEAMALFIKLTMGSVRLVPRYVEVQERQAAALEKQAEALVRLAEHFDGDRRRKT